MPKIRHERYQDIVDKLFEEIRAHFDDLPRVNRLLLELTRIYDPLLSSRVVEPSTHRQIVELLRAGRTEEARRLLEECVELHNQFERIRQERGAGGRGGPEAEPGQCPPGRAGEAEMASGTPPSDKPDGARRMKGRAHVLPNPGGGVQGGSGWDSPP